jgi:hypothetical protein
MWKCKQNANFRGLKMQNQPAFDFDNIPSPQSKPLCDYGYRPTRDERFEKFHARNEHVYRLIKEIALDMLRSGKTHSSMKKIYEIIRDMAPVHTDGKPYKLNNDFTPCYTRLLIKDVPELAGFFETREHVQAA